MCLRRIEGLALVWPLASERQSGGEDGLWTSGACEQRSRASLHDRAGCAREHAINGTPGPGRSSSRGKLKKVSVHSGWGTRLEETIGVVAARRLPARR